ncbi:hypothetical protein JOC37_000469 [Desulfohalotomaculum tongense]|uniref:hypothetical protein n=1 Tax=Desulforadius tongensis TaxID=1216062 RepID=UPI0019560EBC|nr:hypothetical protein [Desulforadius tongensis]MBM7854097.1 hypothetical protein [Desulforadius tongensis]
MAPAGNENFGSYLKERTSFSEQLPNLAKTAGGDRVTHTSALPAFEPRRAKYAWDPAAARRLSASLACGTKPVSGVQILPGSAR